MLITFTNKWTIILFDQSKYLKLMASICPLNRIGFLDVFCVDETRVVLNYPPETNDYIHANWVDVVSIKQRFICTQVCLFNLIIWTIFFSFKSFVFFLFYFRCILTSFEKFQRLQHNHSHYAMETYILGILRFLKILKHILDYW